MNESSTSRLLVDVEAIAAGGDGIARDPEGRVVFVPRSAPGDRVEVDVTEVHRQWMRARLVAVVASGAGRREPPCPYYARCGGCQLQHLDEDAQCAAKTRIVADALRRLGGVEIAPGDVVPSPKAFEYRNRVAFILRRETPLRAGYHAVDDPDGVVDVSRCMLAEPPIHAVWECLRARWGDDAARMPGGDELRLTLRAATDGTVGLAVEGARDQGDLEALVGEIDDLASAWIVGGGRVTWWTGERELAETWGPYRVGLAGTAFVQVNRAAAARLEEYALAQCGDVSGAAVVDAYCGVGLRSVALARAGASVTGIEIDDGAVATATRVAGEAVVGVRFLAAPVERALRRALPADVVVLNPPRRGLPREVRNELVRRPPRRLVYVSCDPATLARDVQSLAQRFDLAALCAFDLFPQTAHVETVVTLVSR